MKKIYAIKFQANKNLIQLVLLTVVLLSASFIGYSQVRVPFTPRTSDYSPNQTVYNVKGDFTMVGNTNLTLVNYNSSRDNSSNDMRFVDVDGDPSTANSSMSTLALSTENGANPECSNIIYAGLYWTGRNRGASYTDLRRRTIKFKGPGQSYQTLIADATDIRYPGDNDMFAGYKEVTDIVKNGGLGDYYVADIALTEGNGGSTGYYGGWGMVVVYENSKMNWRDVTVFDGYAYVVGSTTASHTIDVSGFNTVQNGDVKIKLGMMAGEGDVGISGDYFQIRRNSDNQYQSLTHSGNSTNNFFNSSIQTGGNSRLPNLSNNTGLDIAMFDVPNPNNNVIGTNQTSTRFRYGTTQDTYIVFNVTFSVDAYIPESEGLLSANSINGLPPIQPYVVEPGDVVEYGVEIRNLGTEAIQNARLVIPIPYTSQFVPGSITYNEYNPLFQASAPYFAPNEGATGAIVWDMSYIPLNPIDIREVMADIKFKLSSTTNCSILINNNCSPKIVIVGGNISGTGAISLTNYSLPLIQGYQQNGVCQGEPNTNPIEIDIDSAQYIIDNCTDVSVEREFFYCDFLGSSIPVSAVSGNFPPGSRFYNSYPVTDSSIQYTVNNPFPATIGVTTYYAVPPGDTGCSYIFTIEINEITTTPSISNLVYCLNETAVALTATPTDPDYVVLYYPNNNPSTPGLLTLIPSTSTAGTFTYYVAEGPSTTCVGDRVPITVTVYDEIVISLESMTPTSCIDSSIGAIDISVTGGSGDYTYSWNDTANSTTQDISGLPAGTYTVTINDENSNCTATASFEVLEETNDAPVITAPNGFAVDGCTNADITVGGFTSLPYNETITTITEAEFLAEGGTFADDNIASITYQDSSADSCPILVTRTYTITDDCGLTATANQIITINTPALIISEANGAAIVNCLLDATETFTVPTITDGCGNTLMPSAAVVTESPNPISCEGTRTYTYTFTDCNNNQDTWSYVYNIEYLDFNLPVNEGALVTCVDEAQVVPTPPTVSDNCGVNIIPTGPVVSADPDCVGDKTYTWTYTDCANNSHDWVYTYSVNDNIQPELVGSVPANATIQCISDLPAAIDLTATDNCSDDIVASPVDTIDETDPCNVIVTRTWTFTDACDNTLSVSQTITVADTTAPVAPTAPANVTVQCLTDLPVATDLTATDNCAGTIVASPLDNIDETDPCNVIVTRTWTFTDTCNNSSSVSQIITVSDTIAPVAPAAPANVTVQCITDLPVATDLTATDNCAGTIVASPIDNVDETDPCNVIVTRTWTFTDTCNNSSSVSQIITVSDTIAPVAPAAPAPLSFQCIDEVPAAIELTATDNCAGNIIGLVSEILDNSDSCNITITRTWTFTDTCNNSSSVSQVITVADTTAPSITTVASDQTVLCDGDGNAQEFQAWLDTHAGSQATDNCSAVTWTHEILNVIDQCGETSRTLVRFIATDACNNSRTTTALFTILDLVPPTLHTQASNETVECDGLGNTTELNAWLANNGGATATDLCGNVTWTNNFTALSNGCGETGSATVIFTATDDCGNSATTTATFTIEDTIAPVAPTAPADIVYECITEIPAAIELTATDNCSGDIIGIVSEVMDSSDACNKTITRTWTFTDACDNSSSVSQTITVADTIAPVAPAAPADIAYQCVTEVPAAAELTATDNCSGDIIGVLSEVTDNSDACNITITRTWTFTDTCDNSSSVSQTITVADTIAPVAPAAPADIAYQCVTEVPVAAELTATDNCAGDIIGVLSEITNDADACNITITRTWTFTDLCENTSSISQTITVADTIAPVISVEASNIPIECDGTGNNGAIEAWLANNGGAVASDNCGTITWTNNYGGATSGCAEPIEVTFTATDACGNATSTTASYSILDTVAPVITNPAANETVECDGNGNVAALNAWLANNGGATATDDCSAIAWSNDFTGLSDGCGETGSATVIFTATDGCGNESSTTATFTIIDTIAPVAPAAPADIAYQCVTEVPAAIELTATDNCAGDIVGVLSEVTDSSDACNITITRTWTFTDACDNSSSVSQTITVADTIAPVAPTAPADIAYQCVTEVPVAAELTATDNCAGDIVGVVSEVTDNSDTCNITITRTWTFTDACDNSSSVSQTITVADIIAPVAPTAQIGRAHV